MKTFKNTLNEFAEIPAHATKDPFLRKNVIKFFQSNTSTIIKSIGATSAVNIGANVVFKWIDNVVASGFVEGTKVLIEEDLAKQVFKGTVTTVFSVSGNIFSVLPGGKLIKATFAAAGVAASEWAVDKFETDGGLYAASGAMVVGMIGGYVAGTAIASLATASIAFMASNPVGWTVAIVGACVLVVVAAAATIVWAIEKIVVKWDKITDFGAKVVTSCCNFVIEKAEQVVEFVEEKVEQLVEFVEEAVSAVVEEVKEGWENFKRGCKSVLSWAF